MLLLQDKVDTLEVQLTLFMVRSPFDETHSIGCALMVAVFSLKSLKRHWILTKNWTFKKEKTLFCQVHLRLLIP